MTKREINIKNPFMYGVVVEDDAFCNRKKEMEFLKNQINNHYSTWLFSPRRYGKTSLVEKVFRETKSAICLYVDLYNIKSLDDFSRKYSNILAKNLFNWKDDIKVLSKKLSDSFKNLSPGVSFDQFGNPSFNLNINRVEQQIDIETILEVPNIVANKKKIKICIAFDEFQEIKRIDPFLINWMRSSFQRHQNMSYIFLGSKQSMMEDIFSSGRSPFYEFAVKMNLSVIDRQELFQFIKGKFKANNIPVIDKTINNILNVSECHPHFSQYFASVAFDLIKSGADQNSEEFSNTWLNKVILPQTDIFHNIYDQLTNIQRSVLQALSRLKNTGIYSDEARQEFYLPVNSSVTEALKALQKKALIFKAGDEYKISHPLLKIWLSEL